MNELRDDAERRSVPRPVADDRGDVDAYLRGHAGVFRRLDGWIRAQIRTRYPALLDEEEDLVQTVHGKLLVNLREGRFEGKSSLRSYVYSIMNYTAIDRLRIRYRDRALAEELGPQPVRDTRNPYLVAEAKDGDRLLRQVVMGLSAGCLELWRMVFVDRLSQQTISERLAIPVGTVKSRMHQCRKRAQQMLRDLRDGNKRAS